MSSRSMSRICGGGELYRCVTWSKLNLSGIIPPTTGALMSTVICFFNPASVNPPFSSTWQQQKKYSYLGNMAILQFYQGHDASTCLQFLFVPLWLLSVCLTRGKLKFPSLRHVGVKFLIYLLQAPGLDHHRPPVARHGEHF